MAARDPIGRESARALVGLIRRAGGESTLAGLFTGPVPVWAAKAAAGLVAAGKLEWVRAGAGWVYRLPAGEEDA